MTVVGITALIAGCHLLQSIDLSYCDKVTDAGRLSLRKNENLIIKVYVPEEESYLILLILILLYHLDKLKYYYVTEVEYSVNYTLNQRFVDKNGVFGIGKIYHN